MCASALGRAARLLARGGAGLLALVGSLFVALVVGASPAAAHNVGGGALPAPPWLLGYIGVFLVAATAVALRATWTGSRLSGFVAEGTAGGADDRPVMAPLPAAERPALDLHPGHLVGVVLLILAGVAAVIGPDSAAANISPVAVLVIWWVGLPIACLLAGDVMRAINPFVAVVAVVRRFGAGTDPRGGSAPVWTSAAFLAAFAWFFVAYHRPGSPRALAVFLAVYVAAAVLGGLWWGRRWLATGDAFGGLSAAVAMVSLRRRHASVPPGLAALMVVWIGSTAFDAFASTGFWVDVLGTSQGWARTLLNTVGFAWLTSIAAGVYLLAVRLAGRGDDGDVHRDDRPSLVAPLGAALIPLALGWFLAHDLTLLLFEGQNFIALLSDPLGRGWDLFGTLNTTIDYQIVRSSWVRWSQLALLALGHVGAVVVAHDTALALLRRRAAMRATWAMAGAAGASIVAGALMVLG